MIFFYFSEYGLEYLYDVSTTLNISDVTFFPSRLSHSYDMYAASSDKDDILFLSLQTGKDFFLILRELEVLRVFLCRH